MLPLLLLLAAATSQAAAPPFPGQRSEWNGYERYDFEVGGKPVLVVAPKAPAPGRPWVWHGEFFGHKPAPDIALLGRGFHIVYLRVPDLLGSPAAVAHWDRCYAALTQQHGLGPRPALVGLSRGGLYCYNWAAAHPDQVSCIYGDAPVCDFKSWPGGKGAGKGSERDWRLVLERYGFPDEGAALAYDKNPVDNLAPLAAHDVPLLHVYGDADDVVPWEENTGLIARRYRELGGRITLIGKPGVGHHPHGLDDSTPIVEFIEQHAGRRATTWRETLAIPIPPLSRPLGALQAAVLSERHWFAVHSAGIVRIPRTGDESPHASTGEALHLNSGVLWQGRLYCAHSNYPRRPERSEIMVLNLESLRLTTHHAFRSGADDASDGGSPSLPADLLEGSLTWALPDEHGWWCNFAHYGEQNGRSELVRFDSEWRLLGRWTYPEAVLRRLGAYSLSGGVVRDGALLVTGHDDPVVFRLRLPEVPERAPSDAAAAPLSGVLSYFDEQPAPITGQGLALDPVSGGLVGIRRASGELVLAAPRPAGPVRLRVLTYNIHHGEGVDRRLDLERIAAVIRSADPDIVALQEVDQGVTRTQGVDQPAELARLTQMRVVFGANIALQGGEYGNALLGRRGWSSHRNVLLPRHDDGEQRGVLITEWDLADGLPGPTVFATHFDYRPADGERLASATRIDSLLESLDDDSAILAGDLNDTPESATLARLGERWRRANDEPRPTIPVAAPERQIDYVLLSGSERWRVVETRVLDEAVASDHRPLLAVIEWLP